MTIDPPPDRDLDASELLDVARSYASRPDGWRDQVQFSDEHRHFVSLHRDEHVDVWLICWTPGNDTGWHDHDVSSGAVAVAEGAITEHVLAIGGRAPSRPVPAGEAYCFGPDYIHRLTGLAECSVSVHAYSPPLARMGQYTVGPGGALTRTSLSYADELRPRDAA